jgi:hypothetical protein
MLPIVPLSKKNPRFQAVNYILQTRAPESAVATIQKKDLNSVKSPLDLFPCVQQSYWTSMRATGWVTGLRKFKQ